MTPDQLAELIGPHLPKGDMKDPNGGALGSVTISAGPLLGLGDHAIYSTLPERLTKLGYTVWLDADTSCSNDEVFDLFWRKNPFIKGLSDKKPNVGYCKQGLFYEIANRLPGYRSIEAMERAHGLPPPYGLAPKVYYQPKPFKFDLKNFVLVDFSSVSSKIGSRGISEAIRMAQGRFRNPHFLQIMFKKHISLHNPQIGSQSYLVTSIYEYLDMLNACRGWIGSESGGQSLASAIRGEASVYDEIWHPEIVCTMTPQTFNSRGYTYANVDYHVTSDTDCTQDYWIPHEVATHTYENLCKILKFENGQRA